MTNPRQARGVRRDCKHPRARHVHGTEQAYISDVCRCRPCRSAHAERAAWRRKQYAYGRDISHLVPTAGSRRRLEALMWLGWSEQRLADRLGWDAVTLHRVHSQPRILSTKASAIADLYDELWDVAPPARTKSERISVSCTKNRAQRAGYAPPMFWDDETIDDPDAQPETAQTGGVDEIAVERAIAGDPPPNLTKAERHLVVYRLTEAGLSAREIAARLRTNSRLVQRDRSAA